MTGTIQADQSIVNFSASVCDRHGANFGLFAEMALWRRNPVAVTTAICSATHEKHHSGAWRKADRGRHPSRQSSDTQEVTKGQVETASERKAEQRETEGKIDRLIDKQREGGKKKGESIEREANIECVNSQLWFRSLTSDRN